MTEKPILLNGDMVRAVLSGRKTQTRRIIKMPPAPNHLGEWRATTIGGPGMFNADGSATTMEVGIWHTRLGITHTCPLGRPGERLWVRETWAEGDGRYSVLPVLYRADGDEQPVVDGKWRPSIHMPRWACRLVLDITEVRVQRLRDITEDDAEAEGLHKWTKDGAVWKWGLARRHISGEMDAIRPWADMPRSAVGAYKDLWVGLYGAESLAANPWVWAISFKLCAQSQKENL